jgi:hypothetical protein
MGVIDDTITATGSGYLDWTVDDFDLSDANRTYTLIINSSTGARYLIVVTPDTTVLKSGSGETLTTSTARLADLRTAIASYLDGNVTSAVSEITSYMSDLVS